jgi:hypothetical protein
MSHTLIDYSSWLYHVLILSFLFKFSMPLLGSYEYNHSFERNAKKKVFINRLEHTLNKIVSLQTVYMNLFGKYFS